jgi:hypothetical protein
MRSSWLKWMLIVAALFVAGGTAQAFADHLVKKAEPCAAHHHQDADHQQCCCGCLDCPAGLISPADEAGHPRAPGLGLAPVRVPPLASRFLPPEPDPPRPDALS